MTLIRLATDADLDSVQALDGALFGAFGWSRGAIREEIEAAGDGRVVLVVCLAESVIGYGMLLTLAETADIQRVAVAVEHQRLGVGSRLLEALVVRAAAAGCTRVLLEVAAGNAAAVPLYLRHGFTEIARRPRYYPPGPAGRDSSGATDAIVMVRPLPYPEGSSELPAGEGTGNGKRP